MDPDEIKQMISATVSEQMAAGLKTGLGEFRSFFESKLKETIAPLEAKFKQAETVKTTEPKETSDSTKVLTERLALMEEKDKQREQVAAKERFSKALRAAISPENPLHSTVVEELLSSRLSGLVEAEDGGFYNPAGIKLQELVQEFFASPEGSHFKPAKGKQGIGDPNPPSGKPPQNKGTTLNDKDILEAFRF